MAVPSSSSAIGDLACGVASSSSDVATASLSPKRDIAYRVRGCKHTQVLNENKGNLPAYDFRGSVSLCYDRIRRTLLVHHAKINDKKKYKAS